MNYVKKQYIIAFSMMLAYLLGEDFQLALICGDFPPFNFCI